MTKKLTALTLAALLLVPTVAYGAKPTTQTFVVNNQVVDCLAYNIGGYNYFKLRDVLKGLNNTGDKHNVRYHAADRLVEVVPGEAYVDEAGKGGKDAGGEVPDSQVFMGEAKIKINGVTAKVKSCNIAGYNYLQIRSLGKVLSKQVGYDEQRRIVHVGNYDPAAVKLPAKPAAPAAPAQQPQAAASSNVTVSRQNVAGVQLNIVTVPNHPNLKFNVVKGNNRLVGAEPFGSIIKRTQPTVAVNGNFFDAYRTKVPYGNIVSKGQVIQGIGNDGAFIRTASGKNIIGQPTVIHELDAGHKKFSAWYTNAGLNDNTGIGVFNPCYGGSVKLPQGTYAVVSGGVVKAMGGGRSNVAIPQNGYVIFFAANAVSKSDINAMIRVGDTVKDTVVMKGDPRLAGETADALVAAGPILVKGGKNVAASAASNYEGKIRNQNAGRSAIGVKADGTVVIVTGTARVANLANAMIQLGCVEATNLDGGASSGLYANGRVITSPGRSLNTVLTITK